MYRDSKGNIHFVDEDTIIELQVGEIQSLSKKHFGDKLTDKELRVLYSIANVQDLSRVDDGGYEGALAPLIQSVLTLIGLARMDRRGES